MRGSKFAAHENVSLGRQVSEGGFLSSNLRVPQQVLLQTIFLTLTVNFLPM